METIFVGDLSYFCSDQDLMLLFQPFGMVKSASVRRSANNESLHYGFVQMKISDATAAFHSMQGRKVMGRHLRLNMGKMLKMTNLRQHSIQLHVSFICHDTNLTVNEELLGDIFSAFGKVLDCVVKQYTVISEANKQCGYGFVFYEDMTAVDHAIASTKDVLLRNIQFDCTLSHDSHNKLRQVSGENASSTSPKINLAPSLPSQTNNNKPVANSNISSNNNDNSNNVGSNTVINSTSNIPAPEDNCNTSSKSNNTTSSVNLVEGVYTGIASYGVPVPPPISTAIPYNQPMFQPLQQPPTQGLMVSPYLQPMHTHSSVPLPHHNMSQSSVMIPNTTHTANTSATITPTRHHSIGTSVDPTNSPMTEDYSSSQKMTQHQQSQYHTALSSSASASASAASNNPSSCPTPIQHPVPMMQQIYTYYPSTFPHINPAAIHNNMYVTNPAFLHPQHHRPGLPPTLSPPVNTAAFMPQQGVAAYPTAQYHSQNTKLPTFSTSMTPSPAAHHSHVYPNNAKNSGSSGNSTNNSSSATPIGSYGYYSSHNGSDTNSTSNITPQGYSNSYGYSSNNTQYLSSHPNIMSNTDTRNSNMMVSHSLPATPPYHHQQTAATSMIHHSLSYSSLHQQPNQTHLTSPANNMYFYPTVLPPTHPTHGQNNHMSNSIYYYGSSANPSNASTPTNNFNNNYYQHSNNSNNSINTISNNNTNNTNKSAI